MTHLKYLSWVSYGMALFFGMFTAFFAFGTFVSTVLPILDGAPASAVFASFFGVASSTLILAAISVVYLVAGRVAALGRMRGLQTLVAVVSLFTCPGALYGWYALYVCYLNEESRSLFEQGGLAS